MIKSQFNYCPLVWMFCSRKSDNLINKVQERALRLITNDYQSSFNFLLNKFNEFSVHQRNLQMLMIHQIAPPIMNLLFVFCKNTHNICNYQILSNNVRKTDMVWKLFYIDPLSSGQIYHKSTNSKNL